MENGIKALGTAELWEAFQRSPIDMYNTVANRMVESGIEDAPTMSRVLEEVSPSEPNDELDAFDRVMMEAGIRTKSDPTAGYWASNAGAFLRTPAHKALLTEFVARQWRKVSFGMQQQERATFLSSSGIAGSFERPYIDAMAPRQNQQIAPAIPLSELVAMTTAIDGDTYRSYYLTYDATALRKYRVGETADIPIADLVGAEHTISLKKYGRGLRASYEVLRRMRVDKLSYYIQMMAVQAEIDKVVGALDVLINGDGNSNTTPTTHNLTTLDSTATAGTLTLKGWLAFKFKFVQPYVLTTALMQEAVALQLALLNTGSGNIPLATIPSGQGALGTGLTPINQFADNVRYGWTSDAPSLKIVAFDKRFALERVTEVGSEISEMERFILNQTQVLTFTEVEGYACLDSNGTKILNVNA
jgi:hypothetical protein